MTVYSGNNAQLWVDFGTASFLLSGSRSRIELTEEVATEALPGFNQTVIKQVPLQKTYTWNLAGIWDSDDDFTPDITEEFDLVFIDQRGAVAPAQNHDAVYARAGFAAIPRSIPNNALITMNMDIQTRDEFGIGKLVLPMAQHSPRTSDISARYDLASGKKYLVAFWQSGSGSNVNFQVNAHGINVNMLDEKIYTREFTAISNATLSLQYSGNKQFAAVIVELEE